MADTLVLGRAAARWHGWLASNRPGDLILLDPADAHYGPAGRFWLIRDGKPRQSAFFGGLDVQRAPHLVGLGLAALLEKAEPNATVFLPYRPVPLLLQLAVQASFLIRPSRIVVEAGTPIRHDGWPSGPEEVALTDALPDVVVDAQRKAQWLKLLERCHTHRFPIRGCAVQGSRLGSGTPLDELTLQRAGLDDALHAEVCGSTLFVVAERDLDEEAMSKALDVTHVPRAQVAHPDDYRDLLCAFGRLDGEEFGAGMIERIDFAEGIVEARCDAIPPVPVPILRLGWLRVDSDGRERGELKPWQV